MVTLEEYAQLSNRVYMRTDENRTPIPSGWTERQYIGNDQASGFSAGVYQNGNEIVIAFTGTNEGQVLDWATKNVPVALGGLRFNGDGNTIVVEMSGVNCGRRETQRVRNRVCS